jgi:hypothetical protein
MGPADPDRGKFSAGLLPLEFEFPQLRSNFS